MLKEMLGNSYLFAGNAPFIEELYETWLEKPELVAPEWVSVPTTSQKSAGKAGHRAVEVSDGDFCAWVFLAFARVRQLCCSKDASRLLAG